jgi:hypothetical protein
LVFLDDGDGQGDAGQPRGLDAMTSVAVEKISALPAENFQ